jgi:hypothetical protein
MVPPSPTATPPFGAGAASPALGSVTRTKTSAASSLPAGTASKTPALSAAEGAAGRLPVEISAIDGGSYFGAAAAVAALLLIAAAWLLLRRKQASARALERRPAAMTENPLGRKAKKRGARPAPEPPKGRPQRSARTPFAQFVSAV